MPNVAHDAVAWKPRREFSPGTSGADTKRDHRAEEQRTSRSARAAASSSRRSLREGDCNASVGGYGLEPTVFKAKPARKIVRARPVKAAKDAV